MPSVTRHGRIAPVAALLVLACHVAGLPSSARAQGQVVVRHPGPIVVTQPAPVVVAQPVPVVVRPGYNAYQDALGRLRSRHPNSRRDGAVTLGQFRDPRAVPDLVWVLQNDRMPEVRTAAAFALGAIGDARAANALRHAANSDNNRKVRQAANHAFGKIMFDAPVMSAAPAATEIVVQPGDPAQYIPPLPPEASPPFSIPLESDTPAPPLTGPDGRS